MPVNNKPEDKNDNNHITSHMRGGWVLVFCAVVIILLIGAFAAGRNSWYHTNNRFGMHESGRVGGFMMHRSSGLTSSSQDRVTGTVTAINGSAFTVAGHGSSYQVQTNSSTQYQNGSAVKVNDTVAAYGTTNSGVLTATQVVINP